MDVDEAARALNEMQRRNQQTVAQGSPRRAPVWSVLGSAAGLALVFASGDVSGWAATALLVAGVLLTALVAVALERVTGVRLRIRGSRWWPMALLTAVMLVVAIVVGTVLRFYDVPVASTLSGLAAAVVWIAGVGPVQAAASRAPRDRA